MISLDIGCQYMFSIFDPLVRLTNSKHMLVASEHHAAVGKV